MNTGRADPAVLLEALAASLRARIGEVGLAEERRASFVFGQDRAVGDRLGDPADRAWVVHLARVLHAATDPGSLELLTSLRLEDRTPGEIALASRSGGDPLAARSWIGDLAAAGLVRHELESDTVSLAPLGLAILKLLEEVGALAGDTLEAASPVAGPAARSRP